MKRIFTLFVVGGLMFSETFNAKAQMATIDMTNFYQALLSYLQDGDNMAQDAVQFLENIGVLEEQLEHLKKWNERYNTISDALYKGQTVLRIASSYESMFRMFTQYVTRLQRMEGELTYFRVRQAVNEGFNYLLLASKEVKRAREFLDAQNEMTEEGRREALDECDMRLCRLFRSMSIHIALTFSLIDNAVIARNSLNSLDESFRLRY